ncbi:MAG: glucose 1-dehydrogenase [Acidobacteria bacterium]|nr:glucose 1-dehydrogenase [Acidobacteriota bacterium]
MSKTVFEQLDLTGKAAIVTGGARGLGAEMAEGLAEAGARLMLCDRRENTLAKTAAAFESRGFGVCGEVCDVANEDDVRRVVDACMDRFGRLDILVNNAGVAWAGAPEKMQVESWQKVIDVNLTGCFLFAREAGRVMFEAGSGSIINIASVAGITTSPEGPFFAGYPASKAALIGLTRELAASWGRSGIRVNAIAPGFFRTRLAHGILAVAEEQIAEKNIIQRIGREGELKGAVVFLASEASSYITGQTLVIDGGMTV